MNHKYDKNDDRTTAFKVEKKPRRNDSIGWIIGSLLVFVILIFSIGRITIIGQFIDDVIFTLPFGWYKYFIYLVVVILAFAGFFELKFRFKKRFIAMVIVSSLLLCTLISGVLIIVSYYIKPDEFPIKSVLYSNMLPDIISNYFNNWKSHSLFSSKADINFWYSKLEGYFTLYAGGGFFGNLLAGIFAYTSIFGGLIITLFCIFINATWVLTGDGFYLFKPKDNRRGRGLRILSLSSSKAKHKGSYISRYYSSLNIYDKEDYLERQVLESIKESDITFELPSFVKQKQNNVYADIENNSYNNQNNVLYDYYDNIRINRNYQQQVKYDDVFNSQYHNNDNVRGYASVVNDTNDNKYLNNQVDQADYERKKYEYELERMQNNGFYQNNLQRPANEQVVNKQTKQDNFLRPRERRNNNDNFVNMKDYEPPKTTKYGNVSPETAREKFGQEVSVTPFGAHGKTQEIVGKLKGVEDITKTKENLHQITVEELISENTKQNDEIEREKRRAERSPMYDSFNSQTRILNGAYQAPVESNIPIKISQSDAKVQEVYVNPNYKLPSLELLDDIKVDLQVIKNNQNLADAKVDTINQTFKQFKVNAQVVNYVIGPSVTKFEIKPGDGTKVNSIMNLENDLKLALGTQFVRIESPIQGKNLVGIEIANENPSVVSLKELISKVPIQKIDSKLLFPIGKSVVSEPIITELNKLPHLLVAGSTGSGKSVMINSIIMSILLRAKPNEVKFLMIDPKKVELSMYNNLPHLLAPVISDMKEANAILKKVVSEMERRYSLLTQNNVKNIESYNRKQISESMKLPYIVVVIDELADLMLTAGKKDVEDSIMRLTQMARAAGIHLIVATQRPSVDILTGVIKTNIPARIAFAVTSGVDSRTILDSQGAEKLIGRGDMLFMPAGSSLNRAQGAYISDEEIERVVDWITNQQQPSYDPDFINLNPNYENGTQIVGSTDDMYEAIKEFVIREQKASTSLLQRKFSLGYNRAARIIDDLEAEGIIGPQNGAKPREVYVRYEDLY